MEIRELKRLLAAITDADVSEFTLEKADYKISLKRGQLVTQVMQQAAPAPSVAAASHDNPGPPTTSGAETGVAAALDPQLHDIMAPIVGTFYAAPSPDAPNYVKVGDRVTRGTVLCIIEAMKLMNEIEAEADGVITEVLVENEDPVEYGQTLFRIRPA